jgi:hypothetical protein
VLQVEQGPLLEIPLQEICQAHLDPILFG